MTYWASFRKNLSFSRAIPGLATDRVPPTGVSPPPSREAYLRSVAGEMLSIDDNNTTVLVQLTISELGKADSAVHLSA